MRSLVVLAPCALLLCAAVVAPSCASEGSALGAPDDAAAPGDVTDDESDVSASTADVAPDITTPITGDAGSTDPAGPDDADAGPPPCQPGDGCFLDPCSGHEDCLSGWCVPHAGDKVCTKTCSADCPDGWSCEQISAGASDVAFICVSDYASLCRPCAATSDCTGDGSAGAQCVRYPGDEALAFCGGACTADDPCPAGYECATGETIDGLPTTQCVASGGICECSADSVERGAWTGCESSNEHGACGGKRVCGPEGLAECDAAIPAAEVCNGFDDDCDGTIDGDTTCDDGSDCTADSCLGEAGCEHTPLSGTECVDGDVCTTADHCEDGDCVASPVLCDDLNPCTDDACDASGGCVFEPNQVPCDDGEACTVADTCNEGACKGFAVACDCNVDADCAALEDGDVCNGTLVCDTSGVPHTCKVDTATVVSCPAPAGPDAVCSKAACDAVTGACGFAPDHEGLVCSSGDACTIGQTCQDGACLGGVALSCEDANECTADSCDPLAGCVHTPIDGPCSDGDVCTDGDACVAGSCVAGQPLDCDDGNDCSTDACESAVGCVHATVSGGGTDCCTVAADCPDTWSSPPSCISPAACQGQRLDALCIDQHCESVTVPDDTGCAGELVDCGDWSDHTCEDASDQEIWVCPGSCEEDADCDDEAYCDGICVPDGPIGAPCDADADCESGNCNAAPGEDEAFCNVPVHECAIEDGTGVDEGFVYCHQGDSWLCQAADLWVVTDCASDCGLFVDVDSCQAAACQPCLQTCATDADCDAGAWCDGVCVPTADLGAPCASDDQCASGACGAAPDGVTECVPAGSACALADGQAVSAGHGMCSDGDVWTCGADGAWTSLDCAADCGLLLPVDGCAEGACDPCPGGCSDDAQCLEGAHCDGLCSADVPDGGLCDEPSDCVSGHCDGGVCCSGGDCCQAASDCPGVYWDDPACTDVAGCQGARTDAVCDEFVCATIDLDDDSACAGLVADGCGPAVALVCTDEVDQLAQTCPDGCSDDAECDGSAHCDEVCMPDLPDGADCDEDSDCAAGACAALPEGGSLCLGGDGECALDDGTGVAVGASVCLDSDLWSCGADGSWAFDACVDDCGLFADLDGCADGECLGCAETCTSDSQCDEGAHCDEICVEDTADGGECDEDSDCVSGLCVADPLDTSYCVPAGDACVLPGGVSYAVGASVCQDDVRWECGAGGGWATTQCGSECGDYVAVAGCSEGACAVCPDSCDDDDDCDPGAHCDGTCAPDVAAGGSCDEATDCVSGYCDGSLCCTDGTCCNTSGDCPGTFGSPSDCDNAVTCQGTRIDPACVDHVCTGAPVGDDSGCVGLLSSSCDGYPDVTCGAGQAQVAPSCAGSCGGDGECDDGFHCDGAECTPDLDYGSDCDEDSDCSGNICHAGRCCQEACTTTGCGTGTCDAAGVCTNHTSGQHGCATCQACDASGSCAAQTADGAAATALGCTAGSESCRRCDAGSCGFHTSGQHGCPSGTCGANGSCAAQTTVVCFAPYPNQLGAWVGDWCPAGYVHDYHVCGANGIGSYSWGPYYDDKFLLHNGAGDHCWCCCDCNSVCVQCKQ